MFPDTFQINRQSYGPVWTFIYRIISKKQLELQSKREKSISERGKKHQQKYQRSTAICMDIHSMCSKHADRKALWSRIWRAVKDIRIMAYSGHELYDIYDISGKLDIVKKYFSIQRLQLMFAWMEHRNCKLYYIYWS